jgi:hypothetical protein
MAVFPTAPAPGTVPYAALGGQPALDRPLLAVFVVGLSPQSGKSTVARRAARRLGTTWIESSAIIAARLEIELGLPEGAVARARILDHEAFRPELIALGDQMRAAGDHPGAACVAAGYRIVDGIRRLVELDQACLVAMSRGWRPLVIGVHRPGMANTDNTEAEALKGRLDTLLVNDGSLVDLEAATDRLLDPFCLEG